VTLTRRALRARSSLSRGAARARGLNDELRCPVPTAKPVAVLG
jgi:hypothetical protein